MKPYLTHEQPLRFAHRGSRVLWPENTMVAFQGAVDLGYRYLETDVHVSRDGKVMLFHDDDLDRLTDGSGPAADRDWSDLAVLDAAYHFDPEGGYPLRATGVRIPLLEEAAAAFPAAMFNLDLKQPGIEEAVAAEVSRLGLTERVLIGSFFDVRIRRFRSITGGRVATSAGPIEVAGAVAAAAVGRATPGRADAFQVPERVATRRFIGAAHRAGKQVHVWTINDRDAMVRLLDLGVDGIVSDRPDVLAEVVEEGR